MKVICAYCNVQYDEKEPKDDKRKTHGICEPCFEKHIMGWKKERQELRNKRKWANRRRLSMEHLLGVPNGSLRESVNA